MIRAAMLRVILPGMSLLFLTAIHAAELDRAKLRDQLVRHEGKRSKAYKDSLGILTIGVGFNLERSDARKKIESLGLDFQKVKEGKQELSEDQINQLLDADMDTAISNCKSVFPKFNDLSDVRQRVLVDMMFNLGKPRFQGFKKMIADVNASEFSKAADEMKSSQWYRQVGNRGKRLEAMMRTDRDVS